MKPIKDHQKRGKPWKEEREREREISLAPLPPRNKKFLLLGLVRIEAVVNLSWPICSYVKCKMLMNIFYILFILFYWISVSWIKQFLLVYRKSGFGEGERVGKRVKEDLCVERGCVCAYWRWCGKGGKCGFACVSSVFLVFFLFVHVVSEFVDKKTIFLFTFCLLSSLLHLLFQVSLHQCGLLWWWNHWHVGCRFFSHALPHGRHRRRALTTTYPTLLAWSEALPALQLPQRLF